MNSTPPLNEYATAEHALRYLARADRIPHRAEGEAVLLDFIPRDVERILDLGTGDGRLLALLKIDRPGADAVALDFSPTMLDAARQPGTPANQGTHHESCQMGWPADWIAKELRQFSAEVRLATVAIIRSHGYGCHTPLPPRSTIRFGMAVFPFSGDTESARSVHNDTGEVSSEM